ncbi:hypothetical protein V8F20_012389 [Naviculisporaceae sp. PSN 640]
MKPTLVFLTVLPFAARIGALPEFSSILARFVDELPRGWEWRDKVTASAQGRIYIPPPAKVQTITTPSPCVEECLEREYRSAGCATPKHWDCLCRAEGLAQEVKRCVSMFCANQEDKANLKVQDFMCREMNGHFTNRDNEGEHLAKEAKKKGKRPPVGTPDYKGDY